MKKTAVSILTGALLLATPSWSEQPKVVRSQDEGVTKLTIRQSAPPPRTQVSTESEEESGPTKEFQVYDLQGERRDRSNSLYYADEDKPQVVVIGAPPPIPPNPAAFTFNNGFGFGPGFGFGFGFGPAGFPGLYAGCHQGFLGRPYRGPVYPVLPGPAPPLNYQNPPVNYQAPIVNYQNPVPGARHPVNGFYQR